MNQRTVDLTNCDREPIQIPGAIQPHGLLFACRADDLTITHASANVKALLGTPAASYLGRRIGVLFAPHEAADREELLAREVTGSKPVYLFTLRIEGAEGSFDAIAHRHAGTLFLELEPAGSDRPLLATNLYRLVQEATSRLDRATSVAELCNLCAAHVRRISGFDRVMIYRFDPQWNGQVIAENREEQLEPFLGLHYPASDIPRQAREMYMKNRLRFIADRDYEPARIEPETGPESAQPLDMSFCVLRSVSPIHLEYLRNMGVGASMSISLMREDRLWGLIACHHYSPRFVTYDVRTACELIGQMMSLSLAAAEDRERAEYRAASRQALVKMEADVEQYDDVARALIESEPGMLRFVPADGAAVVWGDEVTRIGQTPGEDQIRQLAAWVNENAPADVFATDQLTEMYGTHLLGSVASGLLAVSLGTTRRHQLMWFRTEQVRTVDWAGDPAKSIVKGDGEEVRLSPRGSFSLWKETVRGRSLPWEPVELEAAHLLRDAITRQLLSRSEKLAAANTDLRLASEEREKILESERAARAESDRLHRMKDEFVATLSHELRTPLNAILGWAQLLGMREATDQELTEGLEIIEQNARTQAQLIEDLLDVSRIISGKLSLSLQDVHLPAIIEAAIGTVALAASAKGVRIERLIDPLHGVQTTGDPQRLQQVIWNLLSNAVKFTPRDGKVLVVLERVDSHVEISVSDTGQGIAPEFLPHVFNRFQQADASTARRHGGLGLGLSIVRNIIEMHGGTVQAKSGGIGQGATFIVSLPVRAVLQAERKERTTARGRETLLSGGEHLNLSGVRVLTVDDQRDARELVRRMLEENGCVVATAGSMTEALAALDRESFDVVISDIGMPAGDGYELIRRMREIEARQGRPKTPVAALTAYARADDRRRLLIAGFQAHLAKPVESGELLAQVASLAGRV